MARQTQINISVESKSAVSSINTLKQAFIDLNNEKKKLAPDGKVKLEFDTGGMDIKALTSLVNAMGRMTTAVGKHGDSLSKVTAIGKSFTVVQNNIAGNMERVGKATNTATDSIMQSALAFEFLRRTVGATLIEFNKLNSSTFGVGIASQMNLQQIGELNSAFVSLSTVVPTTAKEMADAVDALVRTGRTFADSMKIIEQTAILSTASGDSLKDTAEVVTKVMVSLGISGDRVKDTLSTMHSTAIQTASDMKYLADAFKNVAGTASVLSKTSGLAGKELDDYKQRILDVTMASIGSMANLGVSSSMAGTKVKQFTGRLVSAEKVAKTLFNKTMKDGNIQFDKLSNSIGKSGGILQYDDISSLAKEDLPKAIELMSKLQKEGALSSEVLQKMFTARHYMEISNLLMEIDGNIEGFVNKFSKGVDYSADFAKKMFDINEQIKQFKNNVSSGVLPVFEHMQGSVTGVLMAMNSMNKGYEGGAISSIIGGIGSLGITAVTTATALGALKKYLLPLLALGASTPWIAGITGVTTVVMALGKAYFDAKKNVADLNINISDMIKGHNSLDKHLNTIQSRYKFIYSEMSKINSLGADYYAMESDSTMVGTIISQVAGLKELLEALRDYRTVDADLSTSLGIPDSEKIEKELKGIEKQILQSKSRSEEIFLAMSDISTRGMISQLEEMKSYASESEVLDYSEQVRNMQMFSKAFVELRQQEFSSEEEFKEKINELSKQHGINSDQILTLEKQMIPLNEDMTKEKDLQSKLQSELNQKAEESVRVFQELQDIISANSNAMNRLVSGTNELRLTAFLKTNKTSEGLVDLMMGGQQSEIASSIESSKKGIELIEREIELMKLKSSLTESEKIDLAKKEKELQLITKSKKAYEEQLKSMEGIDKANISSVLSEYKYTGTTHPYMVQLVQIEAELQQAQDEGLKQKLQNRVDAIKAVLKIETDLENDKEAKASSKKTTQQIKYTNYLKENLDLELALLQVGKSKAMQEQLSYEYQLKQLQANKKLLSSSKGELSTARDTLSKTGFDATQITTAEQGQLVLKSFYEQHSGTLTGEAGGKLKAMYSAMQNYVSSLQKVEDITEKELLITTKKYLEVVGSIPSIWEDTYSVLQEASDLGLIVKVNTEELSDSKILDYLRGEISKINTDFGTTISLDSLFRKGFGEVSGGETSEVAQYITEALKSQMLELEGLSNTTDPRDTEKVKSLNAQKLLVEALINSNKTLLDTEKKRLSNQLKLLDSYNKLGSVMSKLGSLTGMSGLEDIGGILGSYGDVLKLQADPSKSFDFSKLLDFDSKTFSKDFANAMESAMSQMDMGGSIGAMIGGQSAQAGGALGGLIAGAGGKELAGALGMSEGVTGLALGVAGSLIGGLFDDGSKDQAEADKRSAEQKKIYDKNTEALQTLANNMSNLGGGIDGLNSSLVSSFSKIPTFGNLTNVTDTLGKMYSTMEATRKFESVAYQYTKTKKGSSGFLGIGAKAGTSEIKTVEFSVQEMLNKYGFKGKIEDMTTQQMRDFSTWLNNFDMGESDNFSILGQAIEEYAEALDQFDKNIEKFFYDTTMESFSGISSMQQDELRQQIEDFYKNLGFQIDDAMRETIDQMAESMSVMVTIMGDVRSGFIDTWKDSGKNAGDAFLSSMKPYIDAMLENMSQVFYDVYFSDVTSALDKEFKSISETLVELKKQGSDLNFEDLAGALTGSFANVIANIKLAQSETANFNDILLVLQQQAFESGLTLSEMMELGLVTGTQKSVIDSFKSALMGSDSESAFSAIGDMVGEKVGNALADKMLDNMLSDKILEFSANLDKIVSGSTDMTFESLALLAQESLSTSLMLESEQRRLSAIRDMFDMNKDITYQSQDSNISYETGTTQSVVQYITLTSSVEVSNLVESDSIHSFVKECAEDLLDVLRDKGIDISKISTN